MNNVADLSPPAYASTVHTFLIAVNLRLYLLCHARVHASSDLLFGASKCCVRNMSYLRVVLVVMLWLVRIRLALDITHRRVRRRCRNLRVRSVCCRLVVRPPSLSLCLIRLLSL